MRFRLRDKHYLQVPGTEWEQRETNQQTGKQGRKLYQVPRYLDPDDVSDQNYPGEIIVSSTEDERFPADIVFVGDPTPDMEPLDDEARARVQELQPRWQHPIESLPSAGANYSEALMRSMENQIRDLQQKTAQPESDRIKVLEAQIAELTKLVQSSVVEKSARRA